MRSRIHRQVFILAFLAGAAAAAQAEGLHFRTDLGSLDVTSSIDGISGIGTGLKVHRGGPLALEPSAQGGLFDLGPFEISGSLNARAINEDRLGRFEFAPKWSALARAGVAPGHVITIDGDGSSPSRVTGAGLQYGVSETVALRAEYDHYHYTDGFDRKPNLGEFSVGLKVAF